MRNATELKSEDKFHALFAGPSGSGKTCASVTVGDRDDYLSSVYIFDVDTRIKGILGLPIIADKIAAGRIEFDQFDHFSDPLDSLEKRIDAIHNRVVKKEFDTVVFSSTTSLNQLCEEAALKSEIKHNMIRGRKMTQVQDYGYIARVDKDLIVGEFKTWPCNIVIECHLKDDGYTNEQGEYIVTGKTFNVPGKLASDIPSWFDETYEFYVDDTIISSPRRKVKFQSRLAKTSFSGLPIELDWTGKNFFKTISGIKNGTLDSRGEVKKESSQTPAQKLSGLAALANLKK